MIDTGAAPNLVKARNLLPEGESLGKKRWRNRTGILPDHGETFSTIQAQFKGHLIKFYIIPNHFPIPQEGILGRDFLIGSSDKFRPRSWIYIM